MLDDDELTDRSMRGGMVTIEVTLEPEIIKQAEAIRDRSNGRFKSTDDVVEAAILMMAAVYQVFGIDS